MYIIDKWYSYASHKEYKDSFQKKINKTIKKHNYKKLLFWSETGSRINGHVIDNEESNKKFNTV